MRKQFTLVAAAGLFSMLIVAGTSQVLAEDDSSASIAIQDLPAAVREAFNKLAGGAKIDKIQLDEEGDGDEPATYDAEWSKDGVNHEATVTAEGAVAETEVSVPDAEVPPAVRAAATEHLPKGAKITYAMKTIIIYNASAVVDGKEHELELTPNAERYKEGAGEDEHERMSKQEDDEHEHEGNRVNDDEHGEHERSAEHGEHNRGGHEDEDDDAEHEHAEGATSMKAADSFSATYKVDKGELADTGVNNYFVLQPGYRLIYKDGVDTLTITVLNDTKVVDGVTTRVVEERETENGQLAEISQNYYAIDPESHDVYYFGEHVDMYSHGKVSGHEGSWESGQNGAKFGLAMPGSPRVGQKYYQENAPGVALDRAEIVSLGENMQTPAGTFDHVLQTSESSGMESGRESKWYAPGVGLLKDEDFVLSVIEGR